MAVNYIYLGKIIKIPRDAYTSFVLNLDFQFINVLSQNMHYDIHYEKNI